MSATARGFQTVYDAGSWMPPHPEFLAIGLVGALLAVLALHTKTKTPVGVLLLVPVIPVALYGLVVLASHLELRDEVINGRCRTVEGVVSEFVAEPKGGKGPPESFVVAGTRFEYRHFVVTPGYTKSVANGGVPLDGRYVRICEVDGRIARLEVADRAALPPAPGDDLKSIQVASSADDLQGCKARGGQVERRGMFGSEACVVPFADADRPCTDNSQCSGACIYEPEDGERAPLTSVTGRCQKENVTSGSCYGEVVAGRVGSVVCVD